MTDIEYYIRTILDPYTNLRIYDNGESIKLSAYALGITVCIFPDAIGVIKAIGVDEIGEAVRVGKALKSTEYKYYIYFDKDEHFNHEVNGETVLPFELNHLVPEVYELANKLISKSEKI